MVPYEILVELAQWLDAIDLIEFTKASILPFNGSLLSCSPLARLANTSKGFVVTSLYG
jgi:hypothetical protein